MVILFLVTVNPLWTVVPFSGFNITYLAAERKSKTESFCASVFRTDLVTVNKLKTELVILPVAAMEDNIFHQVDGAEM